MPGSCPKCGNSGRLGRKGGPQFICFGHGHEAYQIDGNDE